MSDVVKFDPEEMQKRLASLMRANIIGLMPDEALAPYIKAAMDSFLKNELPGLVKDMLREHCKKQIVEKLNSSEFIGTYNVNGLNEPSEAVKELIRQLAPDLMQALWGGIIQRAVQEMASHLQRTY